MSETHIDPATLCADCDKPWSEHWGFNCDEPYRDRKFKPLLAGIYPPNRDVHGRLKAAQDRISTLETALAEACDMLDDVCETYPYAETVSRRASISTLRALAREA